MEQTEKLAAEMAAQYERQLRHDFKRAESALRENEEKLRLLLKHSPASIAMLDTQMRYIATSQRWLAQFGIPDQDLHGRGHYEVFPEIPERWKEIHRRCLAGAIERAEADRFERADGRVQWLRWEVRPWYAGSGAVGGIVIFDEDITERKLAEEALNESRDRLSVALTAARMVTFEWDIVKNTRYWDDNFHRLFGTDPKTFAGTPEEFFRVVHPEDLPGLQAALSSCLKTDNYESEYRVILPDGGIRYIAARGKVHRDDAGQPIRMAGVCWDITERKQIEDQIRTLNEELESRVVERTSELRTAVDALETEIAERRRLEREILEIGEREKARVGQDLHDGLCQTLAGIGFLAKVLQHNLEEEKLTPDAASAKAEGIANLLKEAINEARGLAAGLYPVNIEEYGLALALENLSADMAERLHISCKYLCAEPVVLADKRAAAHVYRITQEAVNNAVKHGRAESVVITLAETRGQVTLKIEDDGTGRLSELKPTGMGLKTMNYRARSLGGTLELRDRPDCGIAVVCSFPNQRTAEGA